MSEPVLPLTVIGTILPEMAQKTGLDPALKIIVGGHDQTCAAIGSGLTLLHKKGVTVKDARNDHGLAFDLQHKTLLIWHKLHRYREIRLHVLHGQNGLSGCHTAYNRDVNNITAAGRIEVIIHDLNRAGLSGIPADITVFLHLLNCSMSLMPVSNKTL